MKPVQLKASEIRVGDIFIGTSEKGTLRRRVLSISRSTHDLDNGADHYVFVEYLDLPTGAIGKNYHLYDNDWFIREPENNPEWGELSP